MPLPLQVNVLPSHAEAFVNLRIHSAQTLQEVRGQTVALGALTLCNSVQRENITALFVQEKHSFQNRDFEDFRLRCDFSFIL